MADVTGMIRIGIVSSLNTTEKTARVYFPEMGEMMSGWLFVLQRPGETIETGSTDSHTHTGKVKIFMPKINDRVLVLYPAGYNMNGYILGVIP